MNDCIFCKIINRTIPAKIVYEDDEMVAFHDIQPKADIHYLIIPKLHIESMLKLEDKHSNLLGNILVKINKIALDHKLEGYKLTIHTGEKGGQEVFHLHIHLLANR
ncbi:MAG: histidine triad nucleotide-binding protein [Neisseriaceae bacterium]